jgi:hypothetical protein
MPLVGRVRQKTHKFIGGDSFVAVPERDVVLC